LQEVCENFTKLGQSHEITNVRQCTDYNASYVSKSEARDNEKNTTVITANSDSLDEVVKKSINAVADHVEALYRSIASWNGTYVDFEKVATDLRL